MNDLLKIKKAIEIRKKISFWLESRGVTAYTINKYFTVDVYESVDFSRLSLTEIPFQFGKVTGYFSVAHNSLTSLIGSPHTVIGNFFCNNNNLTSLEGCPTYVSGVIECEWNKLTTLEHAPKKPSSYNENPCSRLYEDYGWESTTHEKCKVMFEL